VVYIISRIIHSNTAHRKNITNATVATANMVNALASWFKELVNPCGLLSQFAITFSTSM
jgi:hypothetical protein